MKWHPGHYYALMNFMRTNPRIMAQVYRELKATPALRGLQVRYEWPELEPEEGRYDFTAIERVLAVGTEILQASGVTRAILHGNREI